jgi:NADH:ubiquinone oxidoreductase subunit 5 (subunit L)/multisubunit Na+/H+ antiporter MnhA subunit
MTELLWALLLPLGAALVTPLVGRVLGRRVGWWAAAVSAVSALLLLRMSAAIGRGEVLQFSSDWPAAEWGIRFSLFADGWGWAFALLVSGIGALICVYAQHYLSEREPRARFFAYMLLFEGAMLGVVLSSNLIVLVVFWELTSIASFLLIGFWHEQERARYGAYKALLITGIGGLALLAGAVLLYMATGTFELRELFGRASEVQAHPLFVPILLLILLGAFTKSAQFPFHLWLPDAMTAPTPVSAYLHSATMVKAGVFLLGRIHPIFRGTDEWFWIVSTVGMATMLLGAYAAVRKTDLKALLAYSTISQLGLITLLYGFGTQTAALAATFHIFNHAAFKAGLFLVVGIVDHETGTRDKRVLAGLAKAMPITAVLCGACALASAGVPLLNGFLSKELFYEETVAQATRGWVWLAWPFLAVVGSIFTFVYSMEVFHGVFFGKLAPTTGETAPAAHHPPAGPKPHDPTWGMLGPVAVLAIACVVIGLWPRGVENWALKPAVWAVWQGVFDFHVALFHGFTTPLMMSALTLAAGLAVYAQRKRLAAVQHRLAWPFGANTIYDGLVGGLLSGTTRLTDSLQNGSLRRYFWWSAGALVLGLCALVSVTGLAIFWPARFTTLERAEGLLGALLIVGTLVVVALNKQRLPAVISLSAVGFLISVLYLVLSAPDLALTQLLIESVTIILFLLVLWYLPKQTPSVSSAAQRRFDALLSVLFGAVICVLVLGVAAAHSPHRIAEFFVEASLPRAGGRNVVNVILVDFRGFDTLGEITVLAIAALGAYALMKIRSTKRETRNKSK